MDGVVGQLGGRDEVFGVENLRITIHKVVDRYWIHVMNMKTRRNVIARNPEIAVVVANKNEATHAFPLIRVVELLIQASFVTKGDVSNFASKGQIAETLIKGVDLRKLGI